MATDEKAKRRKNELWKFCPAMNDEKIRTCFASATKDEKINRGKICPATKRPSDEKINQKKNWVATKRNKLKTFGRDRITQGTSIKILMY